MARKRINANTYHEEKVELIEVEEVEEWRVRALEVTDGQMDGGGVCSRLV